MCGIFAVLGGNARQVCPSAQLLGSLAQKSLEGIDSADLVEGLQRSAGALQQLDELLTNGAGVESLLVHEGVADSIVDAVARIDAHVRETEASLDNDRLPAGTDLEQLNAALVAVRDAKWSIERDRLRSVRAVEALLAGTRQRSAIDAYTAIQHSLSAIDRLEVRGRDSAGIAVAVRNAGPLSPELQARLGQRQDPRFLNNAVSVAGDVVTFVYKAAAEIGSLGDNVASIRRAIEADKDLRELLEAPTAQVTVVSHTRWASVGTVSEPNAHPVDSTEVGGEPAPYVIASLNGDVDNFMQLRHDNQLQLADDITTDAKVIPTLVSRQMANGEAALDAFRSTVAQFEGSVAIECLTAQAPDKLMLAVRGSGQGCYVGFADNAFVVASEPYGLIETCSSYFRIDGETPSPISGARGQVVELDAQNAGKPEGVRRVSYGGEELAFDPLELVVSEITTRDIDRGDAPHFLLKEISESPESVRRTLRGKIGGGSGRRSVDLSLDSFPQSIRSRLVSGEINQILAIGQGTAAVASQTIASVLEHIAPDIPVATKPATELSGFGLRDDMSNTLIVAVSQSGTTTDTNRTVDLARSRGASVIAIVNRRESDLTQKADGVLYTSDGRDVEMSVASTKAFYSQVVAATLLALAIAETRGDCDRREVHQLIEALRKLPEAMQTVLGRRSQVAKAAQEFAPSRRSWALVGNGANLIAARELRIKLSELCYKSIACDVTEDKKHIDLSSEPMIIVCAAGLSGSNASDVVKEVAIYKAHKACPIVICSEGTQIEAPAVIEVPVVHPAIDFVLSTMVGHLFGYDAALAIDAQARMLRSVRATVDDVIANADPDEDVTFARLRSEVSEQATEALRALRSTEFDGHLQTATGINLTSLLRASIGLLHLDALEVELDRPVTPLSMMHELVGGLSAAIDELTRPIDAVKHQAKTVTVGISRTEESYADIRLVKAAVEAGTARRNLSYRSMRLLSALEGAVVDVVGFTRYAVSGDVHTHNATVEVIGRGGIAEQMTSRADSDPRLIGTKHRAAYERVVTVGRGERDGRSVIIVPETEGQKVEAILLLHVEFEERLDAVAARQVLTGYRGRYSALVDAVTETEPEFDDTKLAEMPILELLVEPVRVLADNWRTTQP